jgi:SAM-dependent methyltransferase
MRTFDRILQQWRASIARPFIPPGARVLDVGCHQGEFLKSLGSRIGPSIGMDPVAEPKSGPHYRLIRDLFREPAPLPSNSFDVLVMLATLEHIREKDSLGRECFRVLAPGGRLIITVPSTFVDTIIDWLCRLRLADGMALEEHHGYDPTTTPDIFGRQGFVLRCARRFQLGLNHLFVFEKALDQAHLNATNFALNGI